MDLINIIAGIITIISFVFSIITFIRKKDFMNHMEANLISLINNLDVLAYNSNDKNVERDKISGQATIIRNQTIGILKTFSKKEERYKTYDFGIKAESMEAKIKERKEKLGIDYNGCIIENQQVKMVDEVKDIKDVVVGESVISYDLENKQKAQTLIKRKNCYNVKNYIEINHNLCLTANHCLYVKYKGWINTVDITIGDEIMKFDNLFEIVISIEFINKPSRAFAISLEKYKNLYSNTYLVHNEEDEK